MPKSKQPQSSKKKVLRFLSVLIVSVLVIFIAGKIFELYVLAGRYKDLAKNERFMSCLGKEINTK